MSQKKPLCFSLVLPMELGDFFFFFFCFGGEQGAIYALKKKKKSKVPKTYSSTSTSFSHNNGMEGEDVGPRPLGACLT